VAVTTPVCEEDRLPDPPSTPPGSSRPEFAKISESEYLWRVYKRERYSEPTPHMVRADTFRYYGPHEHGRFDHHTPAGKSPGPDPERGIYYAGEERWSCLREVSELDGIVKIKNYFMVDLLVLRDLLLLDLRLDYADRIHANRAIADAPTNRSLTQQWARYVYDHPSHFGQNGLPVDGLMYFSAQDYAVVVALFERADGALLVNDHNDHPLSTPAIRTAIDHRLNLWPNLTVET
jgi:hypothetical protein